MGISGISPSAMTTTHPSMEVPKEILLIATVGEDIVSSFSPSYL